ncbi:MAG: YggT family protein [Actinobacteria bacterium]|jgi:YggT family protein|nr:YggT family protein [Actinomycetota bacterium]
MAIVGTILGIILRLFTIALIGRLIFDYVRIFAAQWRPRGFILAIAEAVYAVTDPAINFVRRFVPPLRLGPVALDLSFIVIFFGVQILSSAVSVIF